MGVRETSRESYRKIDDLGDQQRAVFEALKKIEPATDREIEAATGLEMGAVNGRRGELVKYGFVVEHGRKYNPATDRNVMTWVTADPMAQRQIEKALQSEGDTDVTRKTSTGKTEKNQVKKYSLKLKSGKLFTITEEMKDEIEEAMSVQRGHGGKITIAGHEFVLSQIIIPIKPQEIDEELQTIKNEQTREVVLEIRDGQWLPATRSTASFRRSQTQFRTQRIGVESGRVVSDLMTIFEDGYESVRDMKRVANE